jgi:hypothetical protein
MSRFECRIYDLQHGRPFARTFSKTIHIGSDFLCEIHLREARPLHARLVVDQGSKQCFLQYVGNPDKLCDNPADALIIENFGSLYSNEPVLLRDKDEFIVAKRRYQFCIVKAGLSADLD